MRSPLTHLAIPTSPAKLPRLIFRPQPAPFKLRTVAATHSSPSSIHPAARLFIRHISLALVATALPSTPPATLTSLETLVRLAFPRPQVHFTLRPWATTRLLLN